MNLEKTFLPAMKKVKNRKVNIIQQASFYRANMVVIATGKMQSILKAFHILQTAETTQITIVQPLVNHQSDKNQRDSLKMMI